MMIVNMIDSGTSSVFVIHFHTNCVITAHCQNVRTMSARIDVTRANRLIIYLLKNRLHPHLCIDKGTIGYVNT